MKTQKLNIKVRDLEPRKTVTGGRRRHHGHGLQNEGLAGRGDPLRGGGWGPGRVALLAPV